MRSVCHKFWHPFLSKRLFSVMLVICYFSSSNASYARRSIVKLNSLREVVVRENLEMISSGRISHTDWLIQRMNLVRKCFWDLVGFLLNLIFPPVVLRPNSMSWNPATLFLFGKKHISPILPPYSCCPKCLKCLIISLCVHVMILSKLLKCHLYNNW